MYVSSKTTTVRCWHRLATHCRFCSCYARIDAQLPCSLHSLSYLCQATALRKRSSSLDRSCRYTWKVKSKKTSKNGKLEAQSEIKFYQNDDDWNIFERCGRVNIISLAFSLPEIWLPTSSQRRSKLIFLYLSISLEHCLLQASQFSKSPKPTWDFSFPNLSVYRLPPSVRLETRKYSVMRWAKIV